MYKSRDAFNKKRREYYWANPEKYRKLAREYNIKNKSKISKRRKELYSKDTQRKYVLKLRYNLTEKMFDDLLISQKYKCVICQTNNPGKRGWQIDHCHKTNVVRGILCISCNTKLGWYEKNRLKIKEYMNE